MARNQFKKHLDIFVKNKRQTVLIERKDDFYYISEGFTLLRLPAVYYEVLARPVNPLFIHLENGQCATRQPRETLPELNPGKIGQLVNIWDRTKAENPAKLSRVIVETDTGHARAVNVGKKIMLYNETYITAMREYCGDDIHATADRFPVLKWEDPTGTGCMVLGINNAAALDSIRIVGGMI